MMHNGAEVIMLTFICITLFRNLHTLHCIYKIILKCLSTSSNTIEREDVLPSKTQALMYEYNSIM